jgi:hypothetical protein
MGMGGRIDRWNNAQGPFLQELGALGALGSAVDWQNPYAQQQQQAMNMAAQQLGYAPQQELGRYQAAVQQSMQAADQYRQERLARLQHEINQYPERPVPALDPLADLDGGSVGASQGRVSARSAQAAPPAPDPRHAPLLRAIRQSQRGWRPGVL